MANKALEDKVAYFKQQDLLDVSDDESGFPDEGFLRVEKAFIDTKAMPPPGPAKPPTLVRQRSSFLGPTPKERKAEFEAHAEKRRAQVRNEGDVNLDRPNTAPEATARIVDDAPGTRPLRTNTDPEVAYPSKTLARKKLRSVASMDDLKPRARQQKEDEVPFWKRIGVIPRELKSGKNVKFAENIRLEPEHKQLFREKIIFFYPNDDISPARRQRIHKIIQLGAAWVTKWRDDITHIMVDDKDLTYSSVLRRVNKMALPRNVVLVKFDPYVPQCIQFNTVLDPTANRFLVKGAPRPPLSNANPTPISSTESSQTSLQVKPTRKQLAAQISQKTDSVTTAESAHLPLPVTEVPSSPDDEVVKDSFIQAPSDPMEEPSKTQSNYDDDLSKAIEETKAIAHLPLDEEEDESNDADRAGTSDPDSDPGTDVKSPEPPNKTPRKSRFAAAPTKPRGPKGFNQANFQCMDPRKTNESTSENPNARTIQVLEEMGRYYDQMQDSWRTLAYRRAVSILRKQTTRIVTREQAAALPFIGPRLAEKIEEIVLTNRLRRLDSTKSDPTDQTLRLFLNIYGAGLSQAHKWLQAGHRSLSDLLNHATLTNNQKVGIEHYTDFTTRIPREEVAAHASFVRTHLRAINPSFQTYTMGSYRRGAMSSGDIDIIITAPATSLHVLRTTVFDTLIPQLYSLDFLKVSLASSAGSSRNSDGTKWHGASCLPGSTIWRRLDLLLVPDYELGAALLYFTGNDIFNRSMRLLASKKGMRLNQRGLYKEVIRGPKRERITQGTLVEGRSEKKIFEILGVPWRDPEERIC